MLGLNTGWGWYSAWNSLWIEIDVVPIAFYMVHDDSLPQWTPSKGGGWGCKSCNNKSCCAKYDVLFSPFFVLVVVLLFSLIYIFYYKTAHRPLDVLILLLISYSYWLLKGQRGVATLRYIWLHSPWLFIHFGVQSNGSRRLSERYQLGIVRYPGQTIQP